MHTIKLRELIYSALPLLFFGTIVLVPEITQAKHLSDLLANSNAGVRQGWNFMLSLVDVVAVFTLIFIAFANILRLNIEAFDIKKLLPGLIVGVILAHFSFYLCREVLVISEALENAIIPGGTLEVYATMVVNVFASGIAGILVLVAGLVAAPFSLGASCVGTVVGAAMLFVPALSALALAIMLTVRQYIVWTLVITSPLAFILYFTPFGKGIAEQWFSWFLKWTFMGPLIFLFIYLLRVVVSWDASGELTTYFALAIIPALAVYVPFLLSGGVFPAIWGKVAPLASFFGGVGLFKLGQKLGSSKNAFSQIGAKGANWGANMLSGGGEAWREDILKQLGSETKKMDKQFAGNPLYTGNNRTLKALDEARLRVTRTSTQETFASSSDSGADEMADRFDFDSLTGMYRSSTPDTSVRALKAIGIQLRNGKLSSGNAAVAKELFKSATDANRDYYDGHSKLKGKELTYDPETPEGIKTMADEKLFAWNKASNDDLDRILSGTDATRSSDSTPPDGSGGGSGGGSGDSSDGSGSRRSTARGTSGPGSGSSGSYSESAETLHEAAEMFLESVQKLKGGQADRYLQKGRALALPNRAGFYDKVLGQLQTGVSRTPAKQRIDVGGAEMVLSARSAMDKSGIRPTQSNIRNVSHTYHEVDHSLNQLSNYARQEKMTAPEAATSDRGKAITASLNISLNNMAQKTGGTIQPIQGQRAQQLSKGVVGKDSPNKGLSARNIQNQFDSILSNYQGQDRDDMAA